MASAEAHPSSSCISDNTSCLSEQLVDMEETQGNASYCCRVCFEDVLDSELKFSGLIAPCKCKGTQKYVHIKCLRRWQENVQKRSLTDERAFRCGVCRSVYTLAPPDPRWITRVVHGITGFVGAAGISLLAFGLTGSPWPHLLLLLLVLLSTRSHALLVISLLIVGSTLAALHAKGLRLVMRLDGGGRLGLAVIRQGAAVPGLGPGTLLVASDDLEHSIFRRSVVLLYDHGGANGARGVILTQPMHAPAPGAPGLKHQTRGTQRSPGDADMMYDIMNEMIMYENDEDGEGSLERYEMESEEGYWEEEEVLGTMAAELLQRENEEELAMGKDYDDYVGAVTGETVSSSFASSSSGPRRRILRSSKGTRRNKIQNGKGHHGVNTATAAAARQAPSSATGDASLNPSSSPSASSSSSSSQCSNTTTRHFFGGPVGMPGEGVWQELAVLHNVADVRGAALIVKRSSVSTERRLLAERNSDGSRYRAGMDGMEPSESNIVLQGEGTETDSAGTANSGDDDNAQILVTRTSEDDEACFTEHGTTSGNSSRGVTVALGDIFQGGSLAEVLEKAGMHAGSAVQIYHGVCSWAEGQLEGEIRAGSWGIIDASPEQVLLTPSEALWSLLMDSNQVTWLV